MLESAGALAIKLSCGGSAAGAATVAASAVDVCDVLPIALSNALDHSGTAAVLTKAVGYVDQMNGYDPDLTDGILAEAKKNVIEAREALIHQGSLNPATGQLYPSAVSAPEPTIETAAGPAIDTGAPAVATASTEALSAQLDLISQSVVAPASSVASDKGLQDAEEEKRRAQSKEHANEQDSMNSAVPFSLPSSLEKVIPGFFFEMMEYSRKNMICSRHMQQNPCAGRRLRLQPTSTKAESPIVHSTCTEGVSTESSDAVSSCSSDGSVVDV